MRKNRFTFLCDDDERRLLDVLSKRIKRSRGDTLRFLVHSAAEELGIDQQIKQQQVVEKVGEYER